MTVTVYRLVIGLLALGNLAGAWKLFTEPEAFTSRFASLTPDRLQWFRWLPVLNLLALAGMWFWQKWAVYLAITCSIAVLTADLILGIRYHLYVAATASVLLAWCIIQNWNKFN